MGKQRERLAAQWEKMETQRGRDGSAMGIGWERNGVAMGSVWERYGVAMGAQWERNGVEMGI